MVLLYRASSCNSNGFVDIVNGIRIMATVILCLPLFIGNISIKTKPNLIQTNLSNILISLWLPYEKLCRIVGILSLLII